MDKWIIITILSAIFAVLWGSFGIILAPNYSRAWIATWITFTILGIITFFTALGFSIKNCQVRKKQQIHNNLIELPSIGLVQTGQFTNQDEEEVELDRQIARLEKQKKLAELKKELRELEGINDVLLPFQETTDFETKTAQNPQYQTQIEVGSSQNKNAYAL